MAELHPARDTSQAVALIPGATGAVPESIPQKGGAGPLWRSLLFPRAGQRAVEFGRSPSALFTSLREMGVLLERHTTRPEAAAGDRFDLALEDRSWGRPPVGIRALPSLLAPGGRWVAVIERKPWVGLAGQRIAWRAWREGFDSVESFFAYPSLQAPRILVPLDSPEPFQFFLRLAVGINTPRQRLFALGARCMCALRLHRMLLPNVIVVARRKG